MTTTTSIEQDVRAAHREALVHLEACQERVRELNRAQLGESWESFSHPATVKTVTVPRAGITVDQLGRQLTEPLTYSVVISPATAGSRKVHRQVDPVAARDARIEMPEALLRLRRAEVVEARLRARVEELNEQERRAEKAKRLPAVWESYRRLDKALVAAARERQAVVDAIQKVAEVDSGAALMEQYTWPVLNQIDDTRRIVRTWTSQSE
jgi:hypothetical protein